METVLSANQEFATASLSRCMEMALEDMKSFLKRREGNRISMKVWYQYTRGTKIPCMVCYGGAVIAERLVLPGAWSMCDFDQVVHWDIVKRLYALSIIGTSGNTKMAIVAFNSQDSAEYNAGFYYDTYEHRGFVPYKYDRNGWEKFIHDVIEDLKSKNM
jgi:hypothetical protein